MSSKNQRSENKKNSNLRLISSTIKNLSRKGINDLTMNDISQGAGLSQGIVNFHFKSKELLLIETLKFISNEYLTSFDKYLKKAG
ncbi:TetR family transcriptional regulator [Pelagibacteraceae bacterium]|nr:TetR family transcriptional regulator [Pelagibacteraceae bacterium]